MPPKAILVSLVVLLAVSIATPVVMGAPVEGVIVYSVVLFMMTGIVPIIIWAFGRFRARNAIVPIVVWGGFLFLSSGGMLLAANFGPMLDKLLSQPEIKKQYVAGLRKSCIDRKADSAPPATVVAQCDCEANGMADQLRFSELVDAAAKGNQTRDVGQKVREIVAECERVTRR